MKYAVQAALGPGAGACIPHARLHACVLCRKNYQWSFDIPSKSSMRHSIKEREASGKFGVLVSADIAGGLEKVGGTLGAEVAGWHGLALSGTCLIKMSHSTTSTLACCYIRTKHRGWVCCVCCVQVPIPVWNDLDECRVPFVATNMAHLPVAQGAEAGQGGDLDFEYLPEYV